MKIERHIASLALVVLVAGLVYATIGLALSVRCSNECIGAEMHRLKLDYTCECGNREVKNPIVWSAPETGR